MENKQTAIMQIIERAKKYPSREIRDYILSQIIKEEESIEIEKEQIMDAAYHVVDFEKSPYKDAEEYYNKTYANDTTKGLPEEDSKRRAWHY